MNLEYNNYFYNDCKKLSDPDKIKNKVINEYFVPVAKRLLSENEDYKSITVGIGSYYSGNANQEVQILFLPSSFISPNWNDIFSNKNEIYKKQNQYSYWKRPSTYALEREVCGGWSPYLGADFFVEAFIKYCPEGANQDQPKEDSHAPFMIISKIDNEFLIKNVAELVRIWK